MVPLRNLYRSTSFRLLAWYAAVFVASVAVLLSVVYWITLAQLEQQLNESVEREAQVLSELHLDRGAESTVRAIQLRLSDLRGPRRYYLLQNAAGERIAGNVAAMTPQEGAMVLPVSFLLNERRSKSGEVIDAYPVVALGRQFANGDFLLVGENRYRAVKAREAILQAFGWGVVITVLLAAAGGAALGRGFLRRIEAINRTTRSIMEGDLSQRVATRGGEDEMDRLSINLNAMLDRIQALMESLKRVSEDVAHDLRTPLSRLRHELEGARSTLGPEADRVIERSVSELDAILATFSALLRIAQIESGARRAAFAEVRLARILQTVAEAYTAVAEDHRQVLAVDVAHDATVPGDRELLTQMVANLVENAMRHCPAGTRITVSVDRRDDGTRLCVADTGPGIPDAERDKVFARFYRLEQSRTTPGSGLGLALVKAVAELHGATIELADNRPGLRVVVRFAVAK